MDTLPPRRIRGFPERSRTATSDDDDDDVNLDDDCVDFEQSDGDDNDNGDGGDAAASDDDTDEGASGVEDDDSDGGGDADDDDHDSTGVCAACIALASAFAPVSPIVHRASRRHVIDGHARNTLAIVMAPSSPNSFPLRSREVSLELLFFSVLF